MKKIYIGFLLAITSTSLSAGNIIWVDNSTLSSGDGQSPLSAFKTIQEAANIAVAGDTVKIKAGVYRETVIPLNSGTAESNIKYMADGNDTVVVSGADTLSGWNQYEGEIYKTTIPASLGRGNDQIFVNGEMMLWARWPNTQYQQVMSPTWDKTNSIILPNGYNNNGYDVELTDTDLQGDAEKFVGGVLHIAPGKEWVHKTGDILSGSSSNTLKARINGLSDADAYLPKSNNRYYITGTFAALDTDGEWYVDNNELYLFQPGGGSPSLSIVEYKRRNQAFDLSNRAYISLYNIDVFAANIQMNTLSNNIHIDGLTAKYLSHYELISGNPWAVGTSNTGIIMHGNNNIIENSDISYSAGNGITLHGSGHKILNNNIHEVNYTGTDAASIFTVRINGVPTKNIEIAYNNIFNAGRSLIVHRFIQSSSIHHNDIHHSMMQSKDGGATYTYGYNNDSKGTVIAYNYVHDNYPFGSPSEAGTAVGIYLDNGSRSYIVTRNIVDDSAYALLLNTLNHDQDHLIINNTLIGSKKSISSWGTEGNRNMNGTEIINNLLVGEVSVYMSDWDLVQSNFLTPNSNNIHDVGFIDYSNNNFSLTEFSPARNASTSTVYKMYTSGFEGIKPDAGALEYGLTPFEFGSGASSKYMQRFHELSHTDTTKIIAGQFDTLGNGVSYQDSTETNYATASQWGSERYREPVDTVSSGYLGWISDNEWLEYSIKVSIPGEYNIKVNGLSNFIDGDQIEVYVFDNYNSKLGKSLGLIDANSVETSINNIYLTAGFQTIKLKFLGGGFGFSNFTLESAQGSYSEIPIIGFSSPTTIRGGDYDTGGEGVAYHDTTAINSASSYISGAMREDEAVDAVSSGFIGWIANGEWLEYTVNVEDSGTYIFTINGTNNFDTNDSISLKTYDSTSDKNGRELGQVDINSDNTLITLQPGYQVIRLEFNGSGYGFPSFTIAAN